MRRVCEVSAEGGRWLVDGRDVGGPEGAYAAFREAWDASLGKAVRLRLGSLRPRSERLHDPGCHFVPAHEALLESRFGGRPKARAYMLGLVGTSYCRIVDVADYAPALAGTASEWGDPEEVELEVDRLLCAGATSLHGRRAGTGRTSAAYARAREAARRRQAEAGAAARAAWPPGAERPCCK